ncbi:winged helix-turn-helix transcriptional regulator [Natronococcus occultus]|uniref:Transcriptional regulator n=1 Tax=Natronococcus occultus SP4 TaxID=694430 RepID=L0K304_9EURY|nr:winged helix-turn-helix transcriptional regulator [Natronococcus occultus]AGB38488.1 transcriptional regulator [Natronococcus occultus SP4]
MRELDETDLEILELLATDARRPYKEIADRVDLTPPAVSDRISRLESQGIIREFTIDIDRERLHGDVSMLVELEPAPEAVADVYAAAGELEGVEHVFEGGDGRVLVHATISGTDVRSWLADEIDLGSLSGYDVTLLNRSARVSALAATGFAHECVVCGKQVTGDGVTATIDGEIKTFCCPSCEERYVNRYESHRDALE